MSKNYWQIKKQIEPLQHGGTIAGKVGAWRDRWVRRCYSGGIPDEVPDGLLYSGRVPSWKSVAMAILRNDLQLRALGFSGRPSEFATLAERALKERSRIQLDLFKDNP